jgi:hypothetical protein
MAGGFGGGAHIGGDFGLGHFDGHGVPFGRGRRFVPGLGYGFNDYGCSYSYPYNNSYSCNPPAY